jgi:hypothetical protein
MIKKNKKVKGFIAGVMVINASQKGTKFIQEYRKVVSQKSYLYIDSKTKNVKEDKKVFGIWMSNQRQIYGIYRNNRDIKCWIDNGDVYVMKTISYTPYNCDVDVEEDEVPVLLLLLDGVAELRFDREQRLRKPFARRDAIHREVDRGHSGATDLVNELLIHEVAVRRQVHEEALLAAVANHLEDEVLPHERLAAHEGNNSASDRLQPVDGRLRRLERHAGQIVVELKAIVAINVALPLGEQVAEQRTELVVVDAGVDERNEPPPDRSHAVGALVADRLKH